MERTAKASYSFSLEGSTFYWGSLFLSLILISVITFGIAFPFVGAYFVKIFLANLTISKQERIFEDEEKSEEVKKMDKEREERLKNM
ncbi:MAG: hypothetical protein ACRC6U_06370 [Fusobacteriaceae bacterium]